MSKISVLEEYYSLNFDNLCKQLGRLFPNFQDSEDCVQEAFSRALKYLDSYNPERAGFDKWFTSILNNSIRDKRKEIRMKGMTQEVVEEDSYVDDGTMSEMDLHRYLKGYKGKTREVLKLYFISGYKPKDICAVLDMSREAVKQTLFRFKKKIKET